MPLDFYEKHGAMADSARPRDRAIRPKPSKVTKRKGGTASTQKHRFQPFSERVAKLNIDSVRRSQARNTISGDEASHFLTALEDWRDRNLSETFTNFAQRVDPYCQSLPQLIHYENEIVSLLHESISHGDALSLEALLDLVSKVAHDLGPRFEKHFGRTVEIVSRLAATHSDVAVIEWSFTCLAWLFKYLARLLVPDLRPLFDLMSPLLGKAPQKDFVLRFAAESLSFLVRKAALSHDKGSQSLQLFVRHVLADLNSGPHEHLHQYEQGLSALFVGAIKGVKRGVASGATGIARTLFEHLRDAPANDDQSGTRIVVEASLINVIHSTDVQGFAPILEVLIECFRTASGSAEQRSRMLDLLYIVLGTRKASRIGTWPALLDILSKESSGCCERNIAPGKALLAASALAVAYAPFEHVLPYTQQLLPNFNDAIWQSHFVPFCNAIVDLDRARFETLVLPPLQKWIIAAWSANEDQLCFLESKLTDDTTLPQSKRRLPASWLRKMSDAFASLNAAPASGQPLSLAKQSAYLDLLEEAEAPAGVRSSISQSITRALVNHSSQLSEEQAADVEEFLLTKGLQFCLCHTETHPPAASAIILRSALSRSESHAQQLAYVSNICTMLQNATSEEHFAEFQRLIDESALAAELMDNLASPDQNLRTASLDILVQIYRIRQETIPDSLKIMREIQGMSFDLQHVRAISLQIRKLGSSLIAAQSDDLVLKAVPAYCFGLLHVRLTPLWSDACKTLEEIKAVPCADAEIVNRAIAWMSHGRQLEAITNEIEPLSEGSGGELSAHELPGYTCVNLSKVDRLIWQSFDEIHNARTHLHRIFNQHIRRIPKATSQDRMQALLVFKHIPDVAEKRSRFLAPILLEWASGTGAAVDEQSDDADTESTDDGMTRDWTYAEKKALLELFSSFVNPAVLYRSQEVYQALLNLLTNGDAGIQRSALNALFTWKTISVRSYEGRLVNILDDARFRDELTLLTSDDETNGIHLEHRKHLFPVLLRLLYGRVVTRVGLGGSRGSQEARRKAVFGAVLKLGQDAVDLFVDISLSSVDLQALRRDSGASPPTANSFNAGSSPRKQLGLLGMLRDMLETLGERLSSSSQRLAEAAMACLSEAVGRLDARDAVKPHKNESQWREVHHASLVVVNLLYGICPQHIQSEAAMPLLFEKVISPRLAKLPIETAQSPSILLKLFATWSSSDMTIDQLWANDATVLTQVSAVLATPSAKSEVKIFVLENILSNVISDAHKAADEGVASKVERMLKDGLAENILRDITQALKNGPSKELLEVCVKAVIDLQPVVASQTGYEEMVDVCMKLLQESSRNIPPRTKGEILRMMEHLPLVSLRERSSAASCKAFSGLSPLFEYFRDAPNRAILTRVFAAVTVGDDVLEQAAEICQLLNSYSSARLDEPDFEARSNAFSKVNALAETFEGDASFWQPILHSLLFLVRDTDELATRSGASLALRQIVRRAVAGREETEKYFDLIEGTLIPALQKGMREESELVRSEYVAILSQLVKEGWPSLKDMACLIGSDDESSYFNNILHVQSHRRVRALHRLAHDAHKVSDTNLSKLCLPLIENFLVGVDDSSQNLANETIASMETVGQSLGWQRFRALLQRLMQDPTAFSSKLKIRSLGAVINSLFLSYQAHTASLADSETASSMKALARTLPAPEALSKSLSESVLSRLQQHIHFQDEASIDIRIFLAVSAVKIILILPEDEISSRLPAILIDVCNILKARAQDARDSARKSLSDIAKIIGARYFGFILKQLRTALKRGYQLHVLAYTVHHLLVTGTSEFEIGSLDYCAGDIVGISMDSTFGHVGQEKEAQGYINSMKEFKKKTVGYDTMELLATVTTLPNVSSLLRPLQAQLGQHRPRVEKVDEMLRRVREGLRRNKVVNDRDFLKLCYELLKEAADSMTKPGSTLTSTKMSSFAFELLRRVLDKHEELKTAQNLEGFMPAIASALQHEDDEVQMAAMRFLSSIIKVPLKGLDEQSGSYIRMAKKIVEASSSVHTENAQTALRLVSAVLRERPAAVIKKAHFESDVAFLLSRVKPDLEEPATQGERDKQVAAFNFLKAVTGRGVSIKEVYDVMDTVREVMITSSTPPIPDIARSVYSRFVLDYFPEEGRGVSRQLEFLTSNLQYEHERGRRSVMEVIMFLLNKRSTQAVQPILVTFFIPLLLVLIADQNEGCRDTSMHLLRKILEKADKERSKTFKAQLSQWLQPDTDPLWQSAALRLWSIYLDVHQDAKKEAASAFEAASHAVVAADEREELMTTSNPVMLPCLMLLKTIAGLHEDLALSSASSKLWTALQALLTLGDAAIQQPTIELLHIYLIHFVSASSPSTLPIRGTYGLTLTQDHLERLVATHTALLTAAQSAANPTLTSTTIQNLRLMTDLILTTTTSTPSETGTLLSRILSPISATLRREDPLSKPWYTKLAAAQTLEALLSPPLDRSPLESTTEAPTDDTIKDNQPHLQHLPTTHLKPFIQDILLPLLHLTSPTTTQPTSTHPSFSQTYIHLTTSASTLLNLLQSTLGQEAYVKEVSEAQRTMRARREERGRKRVLDRVREGGVGEVEGRRVKRRVGDRERRKRKGAVNEGRRRGW